MEKLANGALVTPTPDLYPALVIVKLYVISMGWCKKDVTPVR